MTADELRAMPDGPEKLAAAKRLTREFDEWLEYHIPRVPPCQRAQLLAMKSRRITAQRDALFHRIDRGARNFADSKIPWIIASIIAIVILILCAFNAQAFG